VCNGSGRVGRRLMVHPFANVMGLFDEPLRTWNGHIGSKIVCYEFYETDERRDFVRGAKWSLAPSTGGPMNAAMPARAGAATWGPGHHERVRERFGHCLSWGIFGEDLPDGENRVTLDEALVDTAGSAAPRVTYTASKNSRRLLDFHVERARESLLEAGARSVDTLTLMRSAGWHLLGTARMGSDPATSVVDPWGKAHDIDNLYVVDGSVFVTAGGVNPTNTISALALRFADGLVERRALQRVPA
jgi:choline dehydrogenase-like flavoprotein